MEEPASTVCWKHVRTWTVSRQLAVHGWAPGVTQVLAGALLGALGAALLGALGATILSEAAELGLPAGGVSWNWNELNSW